MAGMTPVQINRFLLDRATIEFKSTEDLIANYPKLNFKLLDIVLIRNTSGIEYRILEDTNKNGVAQPIGDNQNYYWNLISFNTNFYVDTEEELRTVKDKSLGDIIFCLGKTKAGDGYHSLRIKEEESKGEDSVESFDGSYWNVIKNMGSGIGNMLSPDETQEILDKYKK